MQMRALHTLLNMVQASKEIAEKIVEEQGKRCACGVHSMHAVTLYDMCVFTLNGMHIVTALAYHWHQCWQPLMLCWWEYHRARHTLDSFSLRLFGPFVTMTELNAYVGVAYVVP